MVRNRMRLVVLFACISLMVAGLARGDIPSPPHGPIPNGPEPSAWPSTGGTIAAGIALSAGAISLIFLIRNRKPKP